MACQILVSNSCALERGMIVGIFPNNHVFSKKETLAEHLKAGEEFESWQRKFSLVIVIDKDMSDLQHLRSGYQFVEPEQTSQEWQELFQSGQIERTWDEIQPYLIEAETL